MPSVFADNIPEEIKLNSLNEEWLVFDQQTQNYVPYLSQIHQSERRIYLLIEPNKYKNRFLVVSSQQKVNLFIENTFWDILEAEKWQTFAINSFIDSLNQNKKVLFTLYYPDKNTELHNPEAWILKSQEWESIKVEEKTQNILSPIVRLDNSAQTQLIIVTFFTFFLIVLLNQLVKVFDLKNILSFWLNSSFRNKEQINRIGIMEVFTFTVYQVLCLSFTLLIFGKYSSLFSYEKMFVVSSSWQGLVKAWLLFSFFIILLEIMYFLVLSTLGNLYFNKKPTSQLHFSLYIQISQPFYTIFLLISVLVNLSSNQLGVYWVDLIFISLLTLYAFRAILISIELNKLISFRKMYIIFYLCATEFTPLFFVVNILL
jgi:hypothetical protein